MDKIKLTKEQPLKIIYASRTGNVEDVAKNIKSKADHKNLFNEMIDMRHYNTQTLIKEHYFIIVVSTYGEGEPPYEAKGLLDYLQKESLQLSHIKFAICALGDTAYKEFCQTGRDFENALVKHGAQKFMEGIECDVDFEEPSNVWADKLIDMFEEGADTFIEQKNIVKPKISIEKGYSLLNPMEAEIVYQKRMNGEGSNKHTYNVYLKLETILDYEPGDTLGVIVENDDTLINQIINYLGFTTEDLVFLKETEKRLGDVLKHDVEISTLTPAVVKAYAKLEPIQELHELIADSDALFDYCYGRDVLDLVMDYEIIGVTANEFVNVLRKLPPRFYSISSAPEVDKDIVQIVLEQVRYERAGRLHKGVCSNMLTDKNTRLAVKVFIRRNKRFKLPSNNEPIIMIGPGTGIAPFLSFIKRRSAQLSNKQWLFFGHQTMAYDYLFAEEIQSWVSLNVIEKLSLAFSRDQPEKYYVQNAMKEEREEIAQWIKAGAYVYICGDKKNMAKAVKNTLNRILIEELDLGLETLSSEGRLQEDVY